MQLWIYLIKNETNGWLTNGDTDFFDLSLEFFKRYICTIFIFCLDYVLRMIIDKGKEHGFTQTHTHTKRSRWYPAEPLIGEDNTDDLAIVAHIPGEADLLLHSF